MPKKILPSHVLATMVAALLLISVFPINSEETDNDSTTMKPPARKPFLVAGKMPHLTGILKQHWDDPDLALTSEQQKVLLEIRANTMSAVMGLAQELEPLESSLAQQAMEGAPPEQLAPLVDTISTLKTRATMVHLTCLHNTMEVLDDRQLTLLLGESETH